jgi:hypothetical protein
MSVPAPRVRGLDRARTHTGAVLVSVVAFAAGASCALLLARVG